MNQNNNENKHLKSEFLNKLNERELLNQCSALDKLDNLLYQKSGVKAYIGFDCTANSLHVGSLIPILILKYFQQSGHVPVVLLGGGTTLIGDPSGKDEARKLLTVETIEENKQGIKGVLERFINITDKNPILNNADWLLNFNYLEFLREYGREFTINRMLSFDSVKLRLDRQQPLTFLEFNYMLLQAVDFLYLHKNHDVQLQMGGSDQWGNIVNGIDITRRMTQDEVFGLTTNLITKSDGSKMGKSANGAVWLTKELLSTWDFYQFFRNTDDNDVINYLKKFTEIPISHINEMGKLQGKELNEAKKLLAFEVTRICHGEEEAVKNQNLAVNTFENKQIDTNLPTFFVDESELNTNIELIVLLKQVGFCSSNSEARKLIQNAGIKINDNTCGEVNYMVSKQDLQQGQIKLSLGKKKHILIKIKE